MSKKSKAQLLEELKKYQATKSQLEAKISKGDTTSETREALKECNQEILNTSEAIKAVVAAPNVDDATKGGAKEPVGDKAGEAESEVEGEGENSEPAKVKKEVTAENYVVPKGEEGSVHALLQKGSRFNPETGEEMAVPFVQKFGVNDFKNFSKYAKSLGFTKVVVLHEPKK